MIFSGVFQSLFLTLTVVFHKIFALLTDRIWVEGMKFDDERTMVAETCSLSYNVSSTASAVRVIAGHQKQTAFQSPT